MGRKPRRGQSRVERPVTGVLPRSGETVAEGPPAAADDPFAAASVRSDNSQSSRPRPGFLILAVFVFVAWFCYLTYVAWTAWQQT